MHPLQFMCQFLPHSGLRQTRPKRHRQDKEDDTPGDHRAQPSLLWLVGSLLLQQLYVGANRLPEKGPLVTYWYHVNGTAPATCAHHWKESVDGSSAPDKSRPVPTTAR